MKPQRDPFDETHRFTATLFHTGGKGGWTFAPLPKNLKLPVTGSWGMTPVIAAVDGKPWKATVWRDENQRAAFYSCPKRFVAAKRLVTKCSWSCSWIENVFSDRYIRWSDH